MGGRLLTLIGRSSSSVRWSRPPAAPAWAGRAGRTVQRRQLRSRAQRHRSAGAQQPPTNAGDKYAAVGTNPFVTTSYDPLSTFAVDVDTASYDILRRDVNLGMLPQPASVRLEEYVNDFSYDYPAPTAADPNPFTISLGAAAGVFDRGTALLRVGIRAFDPPPPRSGPRTWCSWSTCPAACTARTSCRSCSASCATRWRSSRRPTPCRSSATPATRRSAWNRRRSRRARGSSPSSTG